MSLPWSLALRALRGRPLRSVLTGTAVALGIAVVLGIAVTIGGLDAESRNAAQASAGASGVDVRVSAGTGLTADDADKVGAVPGVVEAVPLYSKRVVARLSTEDVSGTVVNVVALRGGNVALRPLSIAGGRLPSPTSRSEIVIDQGLAAVLVADAHRPALGLGDAIQLTTATGPDSFTIVGFSNGGGGPATFTRSGVYITETAMLDQFRLGLRTAMVALRLQPTADVAQVAAAVHISIATAVTTVDPRTASGSPLGEVQPLLLLVTVLSVVVGAGATANSVVLAASERRREIGLLRAAGASSRQVFRLFMLEVLVLATVALPFGIAAGVALAAFLEAHLTPADLPVPSLDVTVVQVALAALVCVGAALIGGGIAAVGTGRRPILAGLRPHPGSERERLRAFPLSLAPLLLVAGAVLFIVGDSRGAAYATVLVIAGVLCALPLLAPWTVRVVGSIAGLFTSRSSAATRNLARRRNRTALTLSGLTISVASAVAVSALAAGAVSGGDRWVSQLFGGDVVVRSPVTQTDAVAASIAKATGVRSVLPLRNLAVTSGGAVLAVTTIDTASYQGGSGLAITTPARADALRAIGNGPAVLAPQGFATARGWLVGSSVVLATGRGAVPFTVAGIVDHSFPSGSGDESLIMDRSQAISYFGDTAAGFDNLDVSTTGNTAALMSSAHQFGLSAVTVGDIRASAERALQHALGLLLAVALVALVIAMIAVVNTLLVNMRQGARELCMMRAVGLDKSGARRLVLTEAAVLAASGAVLGVLTGCAVAFGMLQAVGTPGFRPEFIFPLTAAVVVVTTVVGGSIIATLVPAARVARSSIVASIRQD